MKTDLYTRVMLTVIAACLVWLCVAGMPAGAIAQVGITPGGVRVVDGAQQQAPPQNVVIVGWKGEPNAPNVNQLSIAPLPTSR